MKITLTLAEVHAIVAARFGIDNFELDVVSTPAPPIIDPAVAEFFRQMNAYCNVRGDIRPDCKIAAIKTFREFFVNPNYTPSNPNSLRYLTRLAVAKRAVEDWFNFAIRVQSANRMPVPNLSGDGWIF